VTGGVIESRVAVWTGAAAYPEAPPYSPGTAYPEYPFGPDNLSGQENPAYEGVRNALHLLGMGGSRWGRADWNPLEGVVHPGDTVVLKPNLVRHFRETQAGHGDCLITHGSVIRAILDYAWIALQGRGRLIIADAPQNDADFGEIRRIAGLDEIQAFYREHAGFEVEVYDLRREKARKVDGVIVGHDPLPGDPAGYVKVDLGEHSAFADVAHLCHLLYGSEYDTREIRAHHQGGVHEYLVSRTVLQADCVISIPKLKTHKKTGITVCMKNLVGINGNKNWLPHHREGTPAQGGDQYAEDRFKHRVERQVVAGFKRVFPFLGPLRRRIAGPLKSLGSRVFGDTNVDTIRSGNWYGNDTTWRMVLDLNRVLMYADAEGRLHDRPMRRLFALVDGIVGGEGNGPLDATPKAAGVILAGANPVAVDLVSARLMGFDYRRIPLLARALGALPLSLAGFAHGDVTCISNNPACRGWLPDLHGLGTPFQPHFGWKGHIEGEVASRKEAREPCVV
jgi:uncharacterized protein (DUF362 family)